MKSVSVIVPVYNMEKYLNKCMDSLVNQTLEDIEIIVVNDGSSDNSQKILDKYKEEYPNKIKVINQENLGISAARNNGIKVATGKYLGFVDSDDFVDLNMFKHLYKKIEETSSDIVVCNYKKYYMLNEEYSDINVVKNINFDNIYDDPSIINSIDYAPWNKLYKKDLFENIEFPLNKKYEDINAILKIFFKAKKISKLGEYLYFYRINEKGETLTINKKIEDIVFILQDLVNWTKMQNKYSLIENELKKLCINQTFYYLILAYQLNDLEYINNFRNKIIDFLNSSFKGWKKCFIYESKLEIKFISKLILINNTLFKIFIKRKIKN